MVRELKPGEELHGVLVALTTPFVDDGSKIDATRLETHINHIIDSGCHGLVPGGTTGEFTAMDLNERKHLTELCVKYAAGRVPVVAGVGSTNTREILDLSMHAAKAGATALMIVPPFYDPPNFEQLRELLAEVSEASKLPIVYYHIPSASGVSLNPQQLASLSEVGVKYLKDTSGNAPAYTELVFALADKITAFNGWDTLTFYGLAAGAKGCVWGASNIIPELSFQLWDAVAVKKDLELARELWKKIFPLCKFLEQHNYPSAVKTAMELQGIKTGGVRKPFSFLRGEQRVELRNILLDAGLEIKAG
ncbi:hypothetical protein H2200_010313 [Cladophialophora chaetospira]|uniref:4-hydroxy-tetrahydrodipicolinate synthase n=1 Tax=Cladophialophora chaetospira TaxID=386627 RepID=A0AA39CE59_9EURO|nr:hypothetical protein H2200_010313 [Cladophialophora chaetospira]